MIHLAMNKKPKKNSPTVAKIKFPRDMLDRPVLTVATAIRQLNYPSIYGNSKNFVELSIDQLF